MSNWNRLNADTFLAAIESLADYEGLIASEEDLSERFDSEIAPHVIEQYGEDDSVAMNEEFNNWTDSLTRDGELHPEQYNSYCYVGKWSN